MYRIVATEIIKEKVDYRAYRTKYAKRYRELAFIPPKVYRVLGRENHLVFLESQAFASWLEAEQLMAKVSADEELQRLEQEMAEEDRILVGSTQTYVLTDY